MAATTSLIDDFEAALLSVDRVAAGRILAEVSSRDGITATLERLVVPAIQRVGDAWERGEASLAQVYMGGRICQDLVKAALVDVGSPRAGQPRIGTGVLQDSHTLGQQMVTGMLRAAGYEVHDLGSRLSVDDVASACEREDLQVVMISVLMLRSALSVADLKARLVDLGLETALVVGGAPFRFDQHLWREVGADYCGQNAADAVRIMKEIR
jgi:methanogenic corrinoid protein MtbC1